MLYPILVWLHVVAAAIAVGANVTYGVWLARVRTHPGALPFTLATVKFIDDRIANPAYVFVAITGVVLVWLGPLSFTTPWVLASIVLFLAVAAIGFLMYTPTLKAQVALAEARRHDTAEFAALSRTGRILGPLIGVLVVAILFLMVVQPPLWG